MEKIRSMWDKNVNSSCYINHDLGFLGCKGALFSRRLYILYQLQAMLLMFCHFSQIEITVVICLCYLCRLQGPVNNRHQSLSLWSPLNRRAIRPAPSVQLCPVLFSLDIENNTVDLQLQIIQNDGDCSDHKENKPQEK